MKRICKNIMAVMSLFVLMISLSVDASATSFDEDVGITIEANDIIFDVISNQAIILDAYNHESGLQEYSELSKKSIALISLIQTKPKLFDISKVGWQITDKVNIFDSNISTKNFSRIEYFLVLFRMSIGTKTNK